ncbi:hypothetical protein LTR74_006209 [Friedmanniomyces endolithicus]|nr:hypothetical protein LTR74_006209 [Friedmanniomyces endolithicus]
MNATSLSVGQTIELNDDRIATIRFLGPTHFQTGDWVGVELAEASGKNDGSVKGKRYFECEQDHGMFLRPSGIRHVIEQPKAGSANGVIAKNSRPSGVHAGLNGLKKQAAGSGPDRRASAISGSPTPGPRLGTGIRSPTKQLASNGTSSASTSRTNTPPAPRAPRPSLAPPSTVGRSSSIRSSPGPPPAARALSTRPEQGPRMSSTTEEIADDEDDQRASELSPEAESFDPAREAGPEDREVEDEPAKPSFAPPPIPPDPPPPTRSRRPSSPTAASIHSQRTIRSTTGSTRQIEELEAKVRWLERKRMEDRDVKKMLEQAKQERDRYKGIIEKLQNKYRPQQQEIVELKQALSEAEKKSTDTGILRDEHDSLVELLTLDREMAQERAEGMQVELETLRAKNEEMELEILRDENGELSKEMSPEERTSTGWLQMERSNERLREALLRLRDITQDKEAELMEQVDDLSKQVQHVDALQHQYNETKEKLLRSEADTEDLRQQLEVALESEEMIEELTERNGRLDAHAAQLRQTIEELEDLRDINDELQINYSEQEKQLQEEIDFKDSLLNDRQLTAKQQQEALDEADYTITRYRALVSQMQSDLTDLQASKQISETEAADLGSKSRAMLDLNLRLQSSAAKTQVKTLDLELRKLDAQEASEHLAIVQLFLPDAFREERDSVSALLRFKRITFKANLVQGFIKERIASSKTNGDDGENVFAACEVVDKLTWIAAMAERFVSSICSCSVADFASYDGALYELEPVERALNDYIDGLRREDLNERGMADELQRSMAVMEHLGTLHIRQADLSSYADELVMRTLYFQSQLESVASALGMMKGLVETHVRHRPATVGAENDQDDAEESTTADLLLVLGRAETLIQSARNAKVMAGKTTRALVDLQARALTLDREHSPDFDAIEGAAAVVARYTRQAGEALQELFGEEGRNDLFNPNEVAAALSCAATSVFELQAPDAGPFSALATRLRALQDMLSDLAALPTDLDNTVEFDRAPAPWVARAEQLRMTKTTSVDTAAELDRALETLRERGAVLKGKEVELEEQSVRIEMLEARMREAGKRSARIAELERALHEAKDDASRAQADLGKAREVMEKEVERVREEMGRYGDEQRAKGGTGEVESGAIGAGARLIMQRQEGKIGDLEGAVRYLKGENHRLRLPGPDSPLSVRATMDWLHEPLVRPASEKRKRDEALRKEGGEVLHKMLEMAARPQLVDLTKLPTNRLAWRPKKDVPGWQVAVRREEWAALKGWGDDVVGKWTRPPAARVAVDQSVGMRT